MQLLFGTVLVDAAHTALEHREVALDGVGVDGNAAFVPHVLAAGVVGGLMVGNTAPMPV